MDREIITYHIIAIMIAILWGLLFYTMWDILGYLVFIFFILLWIAINLNTPIERGKNHE